MGIITDKQMQSAATAADIWITEDAPRGAGRFLGRITPRGERAFYFRYTTGDGGRDTLPIGVHDPKGRSGLKLSDARAKAVQWSKLYRSGIKNLRAHFVQAETDRARNEEAARMQATLAAKQAELEQQRRLTTKQLFDRWAATELTPNQFGPRHHEAHLFEEIELARALGLALESAFAQAHLFHGFNNARPVPVRRFCRCSLGVWAAEHFRISPVKALLEFLR